MKYYIHQFAYGGWPCGDPYIIQAENNSELDNNLTRGIVIHNYDDLESTTPKRVCESTANALTEGFANWDCNCVLCNGLSWGNKISSSVLEISYSRKSC